MERLNTHVLIAVVLFGIAVVASVALLFGGGTWLYLVIAADIVAFLVLASKAVGAPRADYFVPPGLMKPDQQAERTRPPTPYDDEP